MNREDLVTFEAEWPDSARLNKQELTRAVEMGLDLDWFARRVLRGAALEAYKQATAEAREAYRQAVAEAL